MSRIELGAFIALEDFDGGVLRLQRNLLPFLELYLPTEMVIREPQVVTPRMARVYRTHRWILNDTVVDYDTLLRAEGFRGTGYYKEVLLFEVWEDYGDDGHVGYLHVGYMYLSEEHLPENKQYPTGLQSPL